jgi:hypothetical protein
MKPHLKMAYIITYETTPEDGLYYYYETTPEDGLYYYL